MKQEKSCGAIVINDNKVLIIKHIKGHYDFPKGHVEKNETERETAIREVKEETNIDIEIDQNYRYSIKYKPKEDTIKEVIYFLGKPKSSILKPQLEEVEKVEWISIEEAQSILTYTNSKEILNQLLKALNKTV